MNMGTYCRAMAAFCRQRAHFEGEYEAFWLEEAEEWNKLVSGYASMLEAVSATLPASPDHRRADDTRPGRPAGVRRDTPRVARREFLPSPVHSIRYRCPKTAAQRECCQGCELLVEYS